MNRSRDCFAPLLNPSQISWLANRLDNLRLINIDKPIFKCYYILSGSNTAQSPERTFIMAAGVHFLLKRKPTDPWEEFVVTTVTHYSTQVSPAQDPKSTHTLKMDMWSSQIYVIGGEAIAHLDDTYVTIKKLTIDVSDHLAVSFDGGNTWDYYNVTGCSFAGANQVLSVVPKDKLRSRGEQVLAIDCDLLWDFRKGLNVRASIPPDEVLIKLVS